jgi:hypothetical protein
LLDTAKSNEENSDYLTDIKPDYHLEAIIYFAKCQLMINYFESESVCFVNTEEKKFEQENNLTNTVQPSAEQQLEILYKKLIKANKLIGSSILKWKLTETNRASFRFNFSPNDKIKDDSDCNRLKKLLDICTECLVYICYKMNKYDECLYYLEHNRYLINLDTHDLNERLHAEGILDIVKLLESGDLSKLLPNYDQIKKIISQLNDPFIVYKFVFDCKLLYVFYVEPNGLISLANQTKLSVLFNKQQINVDHVQRKLNNNSEIDFFLRKFELIQNEWIRANLNDIECRDISSIETQYKKLRNSNRIKEKRFFDNLKKKVDANSKEKNSSSNQKVITICIL